MPRVLGSGMVDTADDARAVGCEQQSVQRWAAGDVVPRRAAEARLLELAAVLDLLAAVLPPEEARLWLRAPASGLDWAKPLDVIREGRFRAVIEAVLSLSQACPSPAIARGAQA